MTALALRRGSIVPWLFVAGFAIVIAVNGIMVWFAVSSFSGLYAANPREKGLHYNDVIAQQQQRDALGWTVDATWQAAPGRLEVAVRDAGGQPLAGAQVTATLVRPVEKRAPIALVLEPVEIGRFAGRIELPAHGNWDVDLVVEAGGQRYAATRRMFLQ
ncbi:MAG: FixH family protein [Reyranellaceae bacterium]